MFFADVSTGTSAVPEGFSEDSAIKAHTTQEKLPTVYCLYSAGRLITCHVLALLCSKCTFCRLVLTVRREHLSPRSSLDSHLTLPYLYAQSSKYNIQSWASLTLFLFFLTCLRISFSWVYPSVSMLKVSWSSLWKHNHTHPTVKPLEFKLILKLSI